MKIGMRQTRRRRASIRVGRCNPNVTRRRGATCLPIKLPKVKGCAATDEHCRLDAAPIPDEKKRTLRKQYLRPRYPKEWESDPDMWLSNFEIDAVLKQYEEADPSFRYLGTLPIDFSAPDPYKADKQHPTCLHPEICSLDLMKERERGKTQIAMVFNLDPHFKSGSHWIALFISTKNLKEPWAAYFDSYGMQTPPLIARLMRSFKLQLPNIKLMYNARRFQYSNSECGMYSIYFILKMLTGMPFKRFCKHAVPDGEMLRLRGVLFSK